MFEVVVDRIESLDAAEYQAGASFYFSNIADLSDFLEICFKSNENRDSVIVRMVEDENGRLL